MRWITRNAQMELLGRLGIPRVLVRYESMIEDPQRELARILAQMDRPVSDGELDFVKDGVVDLAANHTVMGNPVRMHVGPLPLRLDEQWRTSMNPRQSEIVTLLTRPGLRRYGYQP